MGRTSNITDAALSFSVTKPKRNHYDQKLNSDFPQNFFSLSPSLVLYFFILRPNLYFFHLARLCCVVRCYLCYCLPKLISTINSFALISLALVAAAATAAPWCVWFGEN